jgi:hypothetical protein
LDQTYVSCVKAPQHLHGDVWASAKQADFVYQRSTPRIHQCETHCTQEGFSYFAMESGTHCWCAHAEPHAEHLRDAMCASCDDDSTKTCGNVNYGFMSVYKINHPQLITTRHDVPIVHKKSVVPLKASSRASGSLLPSTLPKHKYKRDRTLLPKLSNVRTFGSKFVSKVIDVDHDAHEVKEVKKLTKDSDELLEKLRRKRNSLRRMKRRYRAKKRAERRARREREEEEHEDEEKHEDSRKK